MIGDYQVVLRTQLRSELWELRRSDEEGAAEKADNIRDILKFRNAGKFAILCQDCIRKAGVPDSDEDLDIDFYADGEHGSGTPVIDALMKFLDYILENWDDILKIIMVLT